MTWRKNFKTTEDFEAAAMHIRRHCKISGEVASERLHKIKQRAGRGGADNVVFDFSGNVFTPEGALIGSLTEGGAHRSR